MAVPAEIRSIERPKNTVVVAYGKNKDLYAVRERVGCKYENGRRLPVTGPTIGHIYDGQFHPIEPDTIPSVLHDAVTLKDWGNVMFYDMMFKDVYDDLLKHYKRSEALQLYCIAILRVCYPDIPDYKLKDAYEHCFLSEIYPNVALSKNTVSTFIQCVGKTCDRIRDFMQDRVAAVHIDHHLLIDGTLKQCDSIVNAFSGYSRKAPVKGSRDISILYAFDLEKMEPVCSQCFPGNMLDLTAYETFLSDNRIEQGIIVADKGFPSSAAVDYFKAHPTLFYLNPLKRNSKYIAEYDLHTYEGVLEGCHSIFYHKEKCEGENKWVYAFRDGNKAHVEERNWVNRIVRDNGFTGELFNEKQKSFGTILLESNLDASPEVIYKAYRSRWEIELVMKFYKSACRFNDTREHSDYSVIGSEFCDFLATLLGFRVLNAVSDSKVLETAPMKDVWDLLARAKKVKFPDGTWHFVAIAPSDVAALQDLGLIPKSDEKPKRKPGRPKKAK